MSFASDSHLNYFYDQDLCLLANFPFEQLLVFIFTFEQQKSTCAMYWLMQYYPAYLYASVSFRSKVIRYVPRSIRAMIESGRAVDACKFESRLQKCFSKPKQQSKVATVKSFTGFDFIITSQLILLVSTPLVCLLGIVTNLLIIHTVAGRTNRKQLKEKQYSYMAINSATLVLIMIIQIVSLLNECHRPFGVYCSSVYKYKIVQYFKIVAGESLATFLRLGANFTYVAFTINRLSLVGTQGNTKKRNKLSGNYITRGFMFCF